MTTEERIKAAAEAMTKFKLDNEGARIGLDEFARVGLTAAYPEDFPPKPKWPDVIAEKLYRNANYGTSFCTGAERQAQSYNAGVDDALEAVSPIIETAVAHRRAAEGVLFHDARCSVCEAIDEAGAMTTRDEQLSEAAYLALAEELDWLEEGQVRIAGELAMRAILTKLSEDDPERVERAARALDGELWADFPGRVRLAKAALDAAGPSVVIVKHAREPDPDTSGYLDGWKARAEKAEADRDEWKAIAEERTALKQELRDLQRTARQAEAHLSRHRYLEAHDLLRAALGE